jgi:hypothetical protein
MGSTTDSSTSSGTASGTDTETTGEACVNLDCSCTWHDECPQTGCLILAGQCLDTANIVHVNGSGLGDVDTIQAGIDSIPVDGSGVLFVDGTNNGAGVYLESVTISGGRTVIIRPSTGDPTINVLGNAGLTNILASESSVVYAHLWASQGAVFAGGIEADNATVFLTSSSFISNRYEAALAANGGTVYLWNSVLGGSEDGAATIYADDDSSVDLLYTSVFSLATNELALACNTTGTVTVRNSIIGNEEGTDPEIDCGGLDMTYSASETAFSGTGNVAVGSFQSEWFSNGKPTGDGITTFEDIAQWQTGDPPVDLEGDPRPDVDGTMDMPGAYLPD